jgi:hypothetical protein
MTHARALLHDLPEKNQASQDEYPENNCLDRRIHEKTSFYCASGKGPFEAKPNASPEMGSCHAY